MATVDVYVFVFIRKLGNSDLLVLHSGRPGPASAVFHALAGAMMDGLASGEWSGENAHVRTSGRVLRSMLADIHDSSTSGLQEANETDLTTFRQTITDDDQYAVQALQI